MKRIRGRNWIFAAAFMFLLGLTGPPSTDAERNADRNNGSNNDSNKDSNMSGSILMVGSTSMQAYVSALAEGYMNANPDVTVAAEFTGSGAGIEAVLDGSADIGNSSRYLTDREKAGGAVENVVAIEGIAVCVDSINTVTGLTRQQLADIYTGEVNNWSEFGGGDVPIVVVGREAGSGTRSAFEEILGIKDQCTYANVLDSNGAVMAKVASTPGAIGYISLGTADEKVIVLKLDGVAPTGDTLKDGSYILSSPLVMATKGEISDQNEMIQSWFDYVSGKEGRKIAEFVGVIPVRGYLKNDT